MFSIASLEYPSQPKPCKIYNVKCKLLKILLFITSSVFIFRDAIFAVGYVTQAKRRGAFF